MKIAATELKNRKEFPPLRLNRFSPLNHQPSTINFGDQSEVSNSSSLNLADRP